MSAKRLRRVLPILILAGLGQTVSIAQDGQNVSITNEWGEIWTGTFDRADLIRLNSSTQKTVNDGPASATLALVQVSGSCANISIIATDGGIRSQWGRTPRGACTDLPLGNPGPLVAHFGCGGSINLVAGSNQSQSCDIILYRFTSPAPQVCVAFPDATLDPAAGLQPNGIVTNSGGSCDDPENLGAPARIQETFKACPVVGICVWPAQPGGGIPAVIASGTFATVRAIVSQGSASTSLLLTVNIGTPAGVGDLTALSVPVIVRVVPTPADTLLGFG